MKYITPRIFAIIIFLVYFNSRGYSQPGTLDSSFGNNGKFHFDSLKVVGLRSFAIQKDGKFIVAGNLRGEYSKKFESPGVLRFNSDGTLDKGFGKQGLILFDELTLGAEGQHVGYIVKVAIDKHDKIVVCATVSPSSSGFNEVGLIRLNSNGSLDTKFNKTGFASVSLGYEHWELDMIIQSDNKILVAGDLSNNDGNSQYHFLMRSLSNGKPDTTFGYKGLVRNFSGILKNQKLIQQPDGKIILGALDFPYAVIQLERYHANGSTDSTFGTNGTVRKLFSGFSGLSVESLALQRDGSIITGGQLGGTLGLSRFDSNGKFDSTFGNGSGYYKHQPADNGLSTAKTIFVNDNDKILAAGVFYWNIYACPAKDCDNGLVVFRLSNNGKPDSTFGVNGIGLADFSTEFEKGNTSNESGKAVLQKDGKVLVSGTFHLIYWV